ncbi:uncharacterized protein PHACADRAFT_149369 [Phanerochaete carnosa HHB-10118-sp]|uniref:DUF159-domain-containing protein n=1 Tax=Phanerochaete carnosa (strain HHB-10118-sp) TaxID=650164 RepID=K5URR4_PHACS|nr:uncharacterized protein PHACADRAFT_149369 [Phanerochaete carnosa HHB-10118-sp]EKM52586.1 hypothetical protein PHACADRAFT_149369 [Phanerochaete carnosa HHB-10118-sp]
MCGRFALRLLHDEIQAMEGYNIEIGDWVDQGNFVPRYNIAPRSQAPVIRRSQDGTAQSAHAENDASDALGDGSAGEAHGVEHSEEAAAQDGLVLHTMKWGLVPHWSKYEDLTLNTINARSEALEEGTGMWKSLRGWRRCAVPCQGYYEWLKKGRERLPHFAKQSDGRMMLLAGLWDVVALEGQTEPLYSFTIVTTDACKDMSWLHDRQPVILQTAEALHMWLDTEHHKWDSTVVDLLQPYRGEPLTWSWRSYPVPKEVGKVGEESPTFIQPLAARPDGIQAMFARQTAKALPSSSGSSQQTKAEAKTPTKRKRSASPVPQKMPSTSSPKKSQSKSNSEVKDEEGHVKEVVDLCEDQEEVKEEEDVKPKTEKMNSWEDDEIEILDINAPQASHSRNIKSPGKSVRILFGCISQIRAQPTCS